MNRRQQNYEKIVLEIDNDEYGKLEPLIEVYVPTDETNKYDPKYMIRYEDISGNISKLLKLLGNLKYSTYNIPKNDKEYRSVTASSYTSAFSAYQSIYNYVHKKDSIVHDNKDFEELKIEICNVIDSIAEKYKGIDSKKRKFANSYSNIIKLSHLKLENMIISGIEEYSYMKETLSDKKYKKIILDVESAVIEAVHDRDLITHNDVFAPTDVDVTIYLLIERITYAMILRKIGVKKNHIKDLTQHLSFFGII